MNRIHIALAALLSAAFVVGCGETGTDRADSAPDQAVGADTATEPATAAAGRLLNPNNASAEELTALPGLDSTAIAFIIEERPFPTMIPLHERLATAMDSAALDDLYRWMFIPIDLNTAAEEEILLIPGVGPRMAHEFEEYRPYRAMAEFRREIGKYVDQDEVARLERYVRLP